MKKQHILLWILFLCVLGAKTASWYQLRYKQAEWLNVPPVPSELSVYASALGDGQLAYRSIAVMLQNLGDTGGRVTPLKEYDYDKLSKWLLLTEKLDSRSDTIPYLAAFYFGAIDGIPEKLRPLIKYLYKVGKIDQPEKWRWLAHGVYLARFKMEDLDTAYKMALDLAEIANRPESDLPNWTRQMPAFILNAKGDKEAALAIMLEILGSVGDKLHPNEVNHTRAYICEDIFTPAEAATNPLCEGDF